MKLKKVLCILVLAFLTAFLLINTLPFKASAEPELSVHNINTGEDYTTIQEAINANTTLDGHIILVDAGTYHEHVTINKSISLVGENKHNTTIDGNFAGTVIQVTTDNVNIIGFTIQNSGVPGESGRNGIYVYPSDGHSISHNIIRNNNLGIYLNHSNNNMLSGNNASYNWDGIYLESSNNNDLSGNDASNNTHAGIWLDASSNNTLTGNNASNEYYGIWLDSSNNSILTGNDASNNDYGIVLVDSSNNTLSSNNPSNNEYGIRLTSSSNNLLSGNNVYSNNDRGIYLQSSNNSMIYHNNLANNTGQVYSVDSINSWDNGFEGNYWSDYNETDDNQDGIGDTPYVINANNTDNHPLMGLFTDFKVALEEETYHAYTICNSTISEFQFDETAKMVNFNVTGLDDTVGFCRITIPYMLITYGPHIILVDGEEANATVLPISNATHVFFYFTYTLSTHKVTIVSKTLYELLENYNNLLAEYQNLNSTYYELLESYDALLANFEFLNATYQGLVADYYNLNSTYYELQGNYDSLQIGYNALLAQYDSLNSTYNTLNSQYNSLNSTYNTLLQRTNELESKYDATINELINIRNLMYVFIATTLMGTAILLPFGIKYYRMSNEQKKIIQAYSPFETARTLFKADVERRGVKIGKFEEKYGVKIRPRNTLEDALRSMELKEKRRKG